jgi:hypothetical protein
LFKSNLSFTATLIRKSPDYSGLFRFCVSEKIPAHTLAHTLDGSVFFDQGLMRVSGASMEQSAFIGALFQFGGSWTGRKTLVRFFRILRAPLEESQSGRVMSFTG